MSKNLKYVIGDATHPVSDTDARLIIHCCNSVGAWGRGFVLALSKRDKLPEMSFRAWAKKELIDVAPYVLGNIQICSYCSSSEKNLFVANMVGQKGITTVDGVPPIRYDAVDSCLSKVREWIKMLEAEGKTISVHAPRFGSALAGGDWRLIEKLIIDNLCNYDIDVTIYDLT